MNLQQRVEDQNKHWKGQQMSDLDYKRSLFDKLWRDIEIKPMSLITGMRRLGKSVLAKQMVDKLIERGVKSKQILFFELWPGDNREVLTELLSFFEKTVTNINEKRYVFLDEIQYVKDYEIILKDWYDRIDNIKFVLTGSFSLLYKNNVRDSLAGRYFDYRLFPLSFREYREMKGLEWKYTESMDGRVLQGLAEELNADFRDFLIGGRLPETILYSQENVVDYVNSVRNQMVTQDALSYFEIEKPNVLMNIFQYFIKNSGGILSVDVLSK